MVSNRWYHILKKKVEKDFIVLQSYEIHYQCYTHGGVLILVRACNLLKLTLLHGCFSRFVQWIKSSKIFLYINSSVLSYFVINETISWVSEDWKGHLKMEKWFDYIFKVFQQFQHFSWSCSKKLKKRERLSNFKAS